MALTQISTAGVKDDAVTAGKIPANAVGSSELADNAVDTAAIADDAVTSAKIADNAVVADRIANTTITTQKLANSAVNTDKLNDNAVTSAKIADDAVTNAKIGSQAVGQGELANNAVGTAQIGDGTVTEAKLGSGAVTNAKVDNSAAIAGSKISPDFGSQNVLTTGDVKTGSKIITRYNSGGHFYLRNNSTGANFSSHLQTCSGGEDNNVQTHVHYYHGGYAELLHQGTSSLRTRSGGGVEFRNGNSTRIGIFDPEGIKFGTDTSSANGLNDYEEGSWTPTFDGTWTNISASNVRHAKYTKIGNTVHYYMEFFMTGNNGEWATNSNLRSFPYGTPNSYYAPVNIAVMYGPSGYSMDQSAAGRAYFDGYADRLYLNMGSFNGVRHLWIQVTITNAT